MRLWIDAQLSPALAAWARATLGVEASALRDLGLRDATDRQIFFAAREAAAVVLTKDSDFVRLLESLGPPPSVVWLTLGNSSNERVRRALGKHWRRVDELLSAGESLIEIQ